MATPTSTAPLFNIDGEMLCSLADFFAANEIDAEEAAEMRTEIEALKPGERAWFGGGAAARYFIGAIGPAARFFVFDHGDFTYLTVAFRGSDDAEDGCAGCGFRRCVCCVVDDRRALQAEGIRW